MRQDSISKEDLRQSVDTLLAQIMADRRNGKIRCHEVARLLKGGLIQQGYPNPIVRDGKATYDADYLNELGFEWISKFNDKITVEDLRGPSSDRKKVSYFHSWCEVGAFVVDHHNVLRESELTASTILTIVEEKANLVGRVIYNPCGKPFKIFGRNFLYIPPKYVTRILV